jgi:hypothetical protein
MHVCTCQPERKGRRDCVEVALYRESEAEEVIAAATAVGGVVVVVVRV